MGEVNFNKPELEMGARAGHLGSAVLRSSSKSQSQVTPSEINSDL